MIQTGSVRGARRQCRRRGEQQSPPRRLELEWHATSSLIKAAFRRAEKVDSHAQKRLQVLAFFARSPRLRKSETKAGKPRPTAFPLTANDLNPPQAPRLRARKRRPPAKAGCAT